MIYPGPRFRVRPPPSPGLRDIPWTPHKLSLSLTSLMSLNQEFGICSYRCLSLRSPNSSTRTSRISLRFGENPRTPLYDFTTLPHSHNFLVLHTLPSKNKKSTQSGTNYHFWSRHPCRLWRTLPTTSLIQLGHSLHHLKALAGYLSQCCFNHLTRMTYDSRQLKESWCP